MMWKRRAPVLAVTLALCAGLIGPASTALAHPAIDEALALAEDLELEAAVARFDSAINSGELSRDELVTALTERALLLHALRRRAELMAGFRWLAAIAPAHMLDMRAPPDLTAIWTSIRNQSMGLLEVRLTHEEIPGELRANLVLGGTQPPDLETRFELRVGDGEWQPIEGREIREAYEDGAEVALFAQVLGPGGIILARDGSPDEPVLLTVPPLASEAIAGPVDGDPADESWAKRNKWLLVGIGAGVVVLGGVIGGVVAATSGGDEKQTNLTPMGPEGWKSVSRPMVSF